MLAIQTHSLAKKFGDTTANDDISMHVSKGEIYGLIGLNGAGKTTLIRMLLGMIKPDNGHIQLLENKLTPNFSLWNEIGFLVETPFSYPNLSVRENLDIFFDLRKLKDPALIDKVIDQLKLTVYTNKKAKHLSLGNQQRLGLAKALLHQPQLLILDEPTNGLDPAGIVEIRTLLRSLTENGASVLISSHLLSEVAQMAHRIGIIHEGKLIKELFAEELETQLIKKVVIHTKDNGQAIALLKKSEFDAQIVGDRIYATDDKAISSPELITKLLSDADLPPTEIYVNKENLEMYFLRIIGK